MASNYVEIALKARDDAKPPLDELKAALDELSHKVAQAMVEVEDDDARAKLLDMQARLDKIGERIANPKLRLSGADRALADMAAVNVAFDKLSAKVATPRIDPQGTGKAIADAEEVSLAFDRLGRKVARPRIDGAGAGAAAGVQAGGSFASSFGSFVAGKANLIVTAVSVALAALPAATAGIGAAAGIALGAALLIGSKKVQGPLYTQFHSMLSGLKGVMQEAAAPLIRPLAEAFNQIGRFASGIEPVIHSVFGQLARFVAPLTQGFESLAAQGLGGFLTLMQRAGPAVHALSSVMSGLGDSIGSFLGTLAQSVGPSARVLESLGKIIGSLLGVVGRLAGSMAAALAPALSALAGGVKAVAPALGLVGKIIASLAGSEITLLAHGLQIVGAVLKAVAPAAMALVHALSTVISTLQRAGVFSMLAKTIAGVIGPVAQLAAHLATGLAPILGILLKTVAQVAGALGQGLGQALRAIMPGLTQALNTLMKFLDQALKPLLPQLAKLAEAFIKVGVQALVPLLGPLTQLAALLIRLAADALTPLIPVLTAVAGGLSHLVGWIATAIGWVSKIIGWVVSFVTHISEMATGIGKAGSAARAMFEQFAADAISAIANVIRWFIELPGKIVAAISSLGSDLESAGQQAIQGLINGIESMAGSVIAAVQSLASQVAGAFKGILSIFSPSKVFEGFGNMIVLGLARGLHASGPAVDAAKQLARKVMSGFNPTAIQQAMKQLAKSVRQSAEQFADISAITPPQGKKLTGKMLLHGLTADLSTIRKFNTDLEKLAKIGLDKTLLQEIIQAGPDQGLQIAEALLNGPVSRIYNLNKTERAIERASRHLGHTAGGVIYGTDGDPNAPKGHPIGQGGLDITMTAKSSDGLMREVFKAIRLEVRRTGGGGPDSVQRAFGRVTAA